MLSQEGNHRPQNKEIESLLLNQNFKVQWLRLLSCLVLVGLSHDGHAQVEATASSAAMSLADVYELAKTNAPELAIAEFRFDSAAADRDIAKGSMFPQISIFGDWSENKFRYEEGLLAERPTQDYPGERYGLQLRTPILNMRSFREYERQRFLADQSEIEIAVVRSELLSDVARSYLGVLLASEDLRQSESELTALLEQYEEAEALYERRLLAVTQLLETQTRTETVKADVVDAEGKRSIAIEQLAQLIGSRSVTPAPVASEIVLVNNLVSIDHAERRALEFDPAISAAEEALRAAEKGISREKGTWWPEIDFVYNSQYSDIGFDNVTSPPRSTESYSISMRYPLFEGGAGSARLRKAWAEYYQARERLEAERRIAAGRARSAWVSMQAASERMQAERQALEAAGINLEAAKKAVRAGTAKPTDVLLALAYQTRARRDLNSAKFEYAMSWLELGVSTGQEPDQLASDLSLGLMAEK